MAAMVSITAEMFWKRQGFFSHSLSRRKHVYENLERGSSTSAFLTVLVGVRDDKAERKKDG